MFFIFTWFLCDIVCCPFLCWKRQIDFYFPPVVKKKKSGNRKGSRKRLKKTFILSDSEDDGAICQQNTTSDPICESEKEDQTAVSSLCANAKMGDQDLKRLVRFIFEYQNIQVHLWVWLHVLDCIFLLDPSVCCTLYSRGSSI